MIIRDVQGRATHLLGCIEDYSARRKSERALRLTQLAMDRGADALLFVDSGGRICYANETAGSMLRKSRGALLAMTVFDLLPGQTPELWAQTWRLSRVSGIIRFEVENVQAGAASFPAEIVCNHLRREEQELSCVAIRDVSEERRSRKALADSELRYRHLVESVTDYIYTVTISDGKAVSTSHGPGCVAVTGYDSEEYRRDPYLWVNMVPGSDRPAVLEQAAILLSGAAARPLEHRIVHKDGGIRWVKNTPVPRRDDSGRLVGYDGLISDITARRRAEEEMRALNLHLLAANREKEVLMKELHHRVKNNLQVISSLLKLQSNAVKDSRVVELLGECRARIKTMALVHEKMYQSRSLSEVDMGEYLRSLGGHLFNIFGVKTGRIRLKVVADAVALSLDKAIPCSLLVNELISNALKYAFPDDRSGEIGITLRVPEPNRIQVEVSDNGVGFPEGLDFRNTASLGMQLVMTFVEQLGGEIEMGRGQGASFLITFQPGLPAAGDRLPPAAPA